MSFDTKVSKVLNKQDIFDIKSEINRVNISESLEKYIIELVFATRNPLEYGLKEEAEYIQFGVSPRASINLNLAAKAMAFLNERDFVLPDDIQEVAKDVLNHRIILNYEAEADGVNSRQLVDNILRKVAITK
jgi:MoxR-like ATPase